MEQICEMCIRDSISKGKLGLSPYYQMPQFKDIGVEIQLGQSVSHPCWLVLIVNPSSLFAGTYKPTALFQADKESAQQVKHRLRNILDKIGVDRRLKEFKLSLIHICPSTSVFTSIVKLK